VTVNAMGPVRGGVSILSPTHVAVQVEGWMENNPQPLILKQ
jgi:hypothetical protein